MKQRLKEMEDETNKLTAPAEGSEEGAILWLPVSQHTIPSLTPGRVLRCCAQQPKTCARSLSVASTSGPNPKSCRRTLHPAAQWTA